MVNLEELKTKLIYFLGIPIFYLTRRCLSKIDENITSDIPIQGHVNKGFYGDNLVYSKGGDANQESLVIIDEKIIPSLEIVENSNVTDVQTPSPSRVIESLDFVIDSYVDDTTPSYVMSASDAPSAFVLSNKPLNGDFRDTPNSALRNLLLNSLKDDINPEDVHKNFNENKQIDSDLIDKNNVSIQGQDDETHKSEIDHTSSSSEISYVSASSSIDKGQNKTSDSNNSAGNTSPPILSSLPPPPPPPPPLEGFSYFTPKKKESEPDNSNSSNESKTSERLKNKESPMIINKNSLNSVKLRHVHRPSIERSHSEDDVKKAEMATSIKEQYSKAIPPKKEDKNLPTSTFGPFAQLVNLRHVRRPSLENKNERDAITHSQNASESFKPSRYFKSKSVNNLEKTSTNENSGSNTLKRMGISKDAINSVKLKPVVRPNLSLYAEPKSDLPDSVKFGTHEFEEFKEKLNEKLKKPVKILREPSFVDPKTAPERSEIKVNRENVIDDNLDLAKARATMENEVGNKLNYLKNLKESEKSSRNEENESSIN